MIKLTVVDSTYESAKLRILKNNEYGLKWSNNIVSAAIISCTHINLNNSYA